MGSCLGYRISTKDTKYAYKGGAEQAGSSSSVEVTEKNWQDQLDGVSDKWRKGVKKTVHFGGGEKYSQRE